MTTVVLSNESGPEGHYSTESAKAVATVLGAEIFDISSVTDLTALPTRGFETAFLATHGGWCEDGTLQAALRNLGITYTHSDAPACSVMSHKHAAKLFYHSLGVPTPAWYYAGRRFGNVSDHARILQKPICGGGKYGIEFVHACSCTPTLYFEEYVEGNYEVSVYMIGGSECVCLPPVFRRRSADRLGHLEDIPEGVDRRVERICVEAASLIHRRIGARGITKTDFVVDPSGAPFALETDSHPGLGHERGAARQATVNGLTYADLIHRIAHGI